MADKSPNEFVAVAPKAVKLSGKPLIIILAGFAVLLAVFTYSFLDSEDSKEQAPPPIEAATDKPLLSADGQSGLITIPQPSVAEQKRPDNPTITVVNVPKNENAEILRREHEAIRQRMIQAHVRALEAPIGIQKSDKDTRAC